MMERRVVGKSEYSMVYAYQPKDERVHHPKPLVEKEVFGVAEYFYPREKKINQRIRTSPDETGSKQHVVEYFGTSEEGALLFERAQGNLDEVPLLTPRQFAQLILQITEGILFLEQLHIAHNDLHRIENIFVFPNDTYKIGDFGLSEYVKPGEKTKNITRFALALKEYISRKILSLRDSNDFSINLAQEIRSRYHGTNSIKEVLLTLAQINIEQIHVETLRGVAKMLLDTGNDSWK